MIGIRSDWKSQSEGNKKKEFNNGKLFLFRKKDKSKHQVFLDDNIQLNRYNMVDSWDMEKKQRINPKKIWNQNIIRIDCIRSLIDDYYFLKIIDKSLQLRFG